MSRAARARDEQTNFGKVSCHRRKTRFYMRDASALVLSATAFCSRRTRKKHRAAASPNAS